MKNLLLTAIAIVTISACTAKKPVEDPETLPKNIVLKPEHGESAEQEREELRMMIRAIENRIAGYPCSDPAEWKYSPIGAKPCGGPSSYIAYPIAIEYEIISQINAFSAKQAAFNKKHGLMSDCAIVPPPSGITCKDGKAVLIGKSSVNAEVQ